MEEIRSVAVGEDEGGLHGYTLEFLESQITTLEDELVELDRSENVARLKSLVANSQQGGQDQPDGLTNLHRAIAAGGDSPYWQNTSLLDTGAIQVTNEEEVKRHPNYANLERAPAMLVPTIQAASGRRKARIVICGNRIEKADGGSTERRGGEVVAIFNLCWWRGWHSPAMFDQEGSCRGLDLAELPPNAS